jgi:hypothetical protein
MDVLNENREGERKEKSMMVERSVNGRGRKRGILLIDIIHEKIQVYRKSFVLFFNDQYPLFISTFLSDKC